MPTERDPSHSSADAGTNPQTNAQGHLDGIPYDRTSIHEAKAEGFLSENVDTDELLQVQSGTYWSERAPARELPSTTQEENKKGLGKKALALVAGVSLAIGGVFVGSNLSKGETNENTPPAPEPNASAPETPGEVAPTANPAPTEVAPSAEAPVDTPEGELIPQEQQIFYTEDGKEQTYQELVESRVLPTQEYTGPDAARAIFSAFDEMVSHTYTDKEVAYNVNLPDDQEYPTQEHYEEVSASYGSTFDDLFVNPSGELYDKIHQLRETAVYYQLLTIEDPQGSYKMNIVYDGITGFDVIDNSTELDAISDNVVAGHYEMTWEGEGLHKSDFTTNAHWQIDGNVSIKKVE